MSCVFAALAFSCGLATFDSSPQSTRAEPRAVGSTPLRFTNPFYQTTTDRDLGDIVAGSNFARLATAAGGVPPYKYLSTSNLFGATVGISDVIPILSYLPKELQSASVSMNGLVSGITSQGYTLNPIRFNITVEDSATTGSNGVGNFKTEFFRLTLVSTNAFRFAIDNLSSGVQFRSYEADVPVINGNGSSVTFTATNVKMNGAAVSSLEEVGLSLSASDGSLYGKPLFAGTISFTANATDAAGARARSRDETGFGQNFTIQVDANAVVSSDVFTSFIHISGDTTKRVGRLLYMGYPHMNSLNFQQLAGQDLELRIGEYTTPDPKIPNKPSILVPHGTLLQTTAPPIAKTPALPKFHGSINRQGLVKIDVSNESFGNVFAPILTGTNHAAPVRLRIGGSILGSETLAFVVKQRGTKFSLTYDGRKDSALGGGFLLTNVFGKESPGAAGAAYKISFLARPLPGTSTSLFNGASNADVAIGSGFTDKLSVQSRSGRVSSQGGAGKAPDKVLKLAMDAKSGRASALTGVLSATKTDIPLIKSVDDGAIANFSMNVTLTNGSKGVVFSGENGIQIFSRWSSMTWTPNPIRPK
jgi:hypothetical protein